MKKIFTFCLIALLQLTAQNSKPSSVVHVAIEQVLEESNLWKLRMTLPNQLSVSGPQIKLPSGKSITFSVLKLIAEEQQKSKKWPLEEIAASLNSKDQHVRCAALCLLVNQTNRSEDYSSYTMSLEQLKSSGVIEKWQNIILTKSSK